MKKVRLSFAEILDDLVAEKIFREKNLTESKIAEEIGISKSVLSEYKNPKDPTKPKEPRLNTLVKIADYFDVSLDYLVGRSKYEEELLKKESLKTIGFSEKGAKTLKYIMNSTKLKKTMEYLLESPLFPSILSLSHKYRQAGFALSLAVEADSHGIPLSDVTVNVEEIQKILQAFDMSRKNDTETAKAFNASFGVNGYINPVGAIKYELSTMIDILFVDMFEEVKKEVKQIVENQLGGD